MGMGMGSTGSFAVNDHGGADPDENSGVSGWPPFPALDRAKARARRRQS